jgi:hypothetical protein
MTWISFHTSLRDLQCSRPKWESHTAKIFIFICFQALNKGIIYVDGACWFYGTSSWLVLMACAIHAKIKF